MMTESLITQFAELGVTRNEALAYLALAEDSGAEGLTGYEVAVRSGIPRIAVYTVLRKLESLGAAFAYGTEPARYVATAPERLVENLRRAALAQLDGLGASLRTIPKRTQPEPIWILSRYDEVMERAAELILGAERSVWLSVWPRELERLRPALDAVSHRALHRVLHSPARIDPPAHFSAWVDDIGSDEAKAAWSHKILLVVDRREALMGGTEPDADNQAVRTTNPSLVDVATNHIILDITLMARRDGRDCVGVVSPMMRPHLSPSSKGA